MKYSPPSKSTPPKPRKRPFLSRPFRRATTTTVRSRVWMSTKGRQPSAITGCSNAGSHLHIFSFPISFSPWPVHWTAPAIINFFHHASLPFSFRPFPCLPAPPTLNEQCPFCPNSSTFILRTRVRQHFLTRSSTFTPTNQADTSCGRLAQPSRLKRCVER